jgi:hypothetical protein
MLATRPCGVGRSQPAFSAEESLVGRRGGLDLAVGTRTARSLALHHGEFGSDAHSRRLPSTTHPEPRGSATGEELSLFGGSATCGSTTRFDDCGT